MTLESGERLKNQLQAENHFLKEEVKLSHNFGEIVSRSAALRKALYLVERVAATGATVLILGETGTGKELFARAIHNLSARKCGPFIKVDCGAIPAGLFDGWFTSPRQPAPEPAELQTQEEVERSHIMRALAACNWRIEGPQAAAKRLGLHPSTLRSRMRKLNINRS